MFAVITRVIWKFVSQILSPSKVFTRKDNANALSRVSDVESKDTLFDYYDHGLKDVLQQVMAFAAPPNEKFPSNIYRVASLRKAVDQLRINQFNENRTSLTRFEMHLDGKPNPALVMQQKEIAYLLEKELAILMISPGLKRLFLTLKQLSHTPFSPRVFLIHEEILDEINANLIRKRISTSDRRLYGDYELNCWGSCLTRFPGKVIEEYPEYFKKLGTLELGGNFIQTLPPEFKQLIALQSLRLGHNQIQEMPTVITELIRLKYLSLRYNQLQSLPPEIVKLSSLVYICLTNNQFQSMPIEVTQFNELRELNMDSNALLDIPVDIGLLSKLEYLNLRNNLLKSIPAEIGKCTALKFLGLSRNKLTSIAVEIGKLSALKELNMSYNQLKSLPPEIGQLSNLRMLIANNNQLKSLPPEIRHLISLESIGLDHNQLRRFPPPILHISQLRILRIDHNQIRSIPAEIGRLDSLGQLFLNSNRLQRLPAEIVSLPLYALSLRKNQLTSLPEELNDQILLDKGNQFITKAQALAFQKKPGSS